MERLADPLTAPWAPLDVLIDQQVQANVKLHRRHAPCLLFFFPTKSRRSVPRLKDEPWFPQAYAERRMEGCGGDRVTDRATLCLTCGENAVSSMPLSGKLSVAAVKG